MEQHKSKLIQKLHQNDFFRSIVLGLIITGLNYTVGVILIDILGYLYAIIALIMIPINFMIRYFINKYWVFKNGNKRKHPKQV